MPVAGAVPLNAVATFDDFTSGTAQTTFSFPTRQCGTPVAGRRIVVCVDGRAAGTITISGVTCNTNNMTQVRLVYNNVNNTDVAAIYEIVEATGTTCDIVVTCSASFSRLAIQIYDVVGSGGVSTIGATSIANSPTSGALSVPASGCVIGCACLVAAASSTPSASWTEDIDDSNGFEVRTSAHTNTASGSTAFTFTPSAGAEAAAAFAAWGP